MTVIPCQVTSHTDETLTTQKLLGGCPSGGDSHQLDSVSRLSYYTLLKQCPQLHINSTSFNQVTKQDRKWSLMGNMQSWRYGYVHLILPLCHPSFGVVKVFGIEMPNSTTFAVVFLVLTGRFRIIMAILCNFYCWIQNFSSLSYVIQNIQRQNVPRF